MSGWATRDDELPLPAAVFDPGDGLILVAVRDGHVLGCATAERPSPGHVRLTSIAVRPDARRQDVTSRLLDELASRAAESSGPRALRTSRHADGVCPHFQHKSRVEYVAPDTRHLVPWGAREALTESWRRPTRACPRRAGRRSCRPRSVRAVP